MSVRPFPIEPPTEAELASFARLQASLPAMFERILPDPLLERTVVILPSLSVDADVLASVEGAHHYEERMLCMLLLLRLPRTRLIYLTSQPICDSVIDYFLHLLPGVPFHHARERLRLITCHDGSPESLTAKILRRPRLVQRIREAIVDPATAHMSCFTVSALERTLAVRLGIPIYGCDPALLHLGSKSGSRKIFRAAGIDMPEGVEDLRDETDVAGALAEIKSRRPDLRRAVVKLNDGFSGEGNAVFEFAGAPAGSGLTGWVRDRLPRLVFEASDMTWEVYRQKIVEMGAIGEAFIEGADKRSPSVQYRIDPSGRVEMISTHDQVLGGPSGQIFLGCRFPADEAYRLAIQSAGARAAAALRSEGVLGRFAIDFISVHEDDGWRNYAIEVNLRKGGTTHPFLMLQFLTDGAVAPETGLYRSASGRTCFYYASDNLKSERYRGLTPDDLIDIAVTNGLHFHAASHEGVVFHLIGAISEFGKLGILCIGENPETAEQLYHRTVAVLDRESGFGS